MSNKKYYIRVSNDPDKREKAVKTLLGICGRMGTKYPGTYYHRTVYLINSSGMVDWVGEDFVREDPEYCEIAWDPIKKEYRPWDFDMVRPGDIIVLKNTGQKYFITGTEVVGPDQKRSLSFFTSSPSWRLVETEWEDMDEFYRPAFESEEQAFKRWMKEEGYVWNKFSQTITELDFKPRDWVFIAIFNSRKEKFEVGKIEYRRYEGPGLLLYADEEKAMKAVEELNHKINAVQEKKI